MQQFPSVDEFEAIVQGYLDNLSSKKRDKALVDGHRYSVIVRVLKDPRNTAISTAQFRFWVKKMFQLVALPTGQDIVCHDSKPVAMREDIYGILVRAHKQANHGGRDKTSAIVRRRYSWIPKELIARFVRHCPYCIARRIGSQSLLPRTPPDEGAEETVVAAAAAVANSHRSHHTEMHQNHPLAELSYLPVNDKDLGIDCWTTAARPPPGYYSPTTTSPSSSVSGPSSISQQQQQHQHALSTTISNNSAIVTQHNQSQPSMLLSPCGIPSATLDAPQHVDHHPQQQPSFNMCYHVPSPHSTSPENQILAFSSTTSSTSPTTAITPPPLSTSRHHHQQYAHDTSPTSHAPPSLRNF
ncbi:hypothetical protein K492DRAFT_216525 [Lichtheimia hyalospora FSU 10163]|nr:hypothetical protein K492DRAFT_216525 [Lichtheimia hyalospora FSU 10163]